MFKTIDRYVIREVIPPMLLSLVVFTFILEIPPMLEELEVLVAKGVTWGIAFRMLLTLIPQGLGLTIPMSLLTGLLIGLGRMSGDRESVALLACGVSPYRLLRPILILTALAAAANLYVMVDAIPDANQTFRELSFDVISKRVESDVQPQVFFDQFPGWQIYARDIPKDASGWKDVLVADTNKPEAVILYMAARGRLILDRATRTVQLVLTDGVRYSSGGQNGRQMDLYEFPKDLFVQLDPNSVFPRIEGGLARGLAEMTIAELRKQAREKLAAGFPPHQEIIFTQQKFSFPFACLVFAVIGLALGLTVARDGKLAGFVVGIAVIFAYYVLLYVAEALTRGYYGNNHLVYNKLLVAELSRWVPNIILLPFGVLALIWRARWAEGRLPFRSVVRMATAVTSWIKKQREQSAAAADAARIHSAGRRSVVVVLRIPHFRWTFPSILDRYVSAIYLRAGALSFVALLGIFYISNFIDRSDKLFKGQASTAMMVRLLGLMTPQFVYYVIPLAALLSVLVTFGVLSRTSELSVMKACGISLYRVAAPLLVLSVVWSGVLYGLEQQILARANQRADALDALIRGRQPKLANPLDRRWLVGKNGDIYHYGYFDPSRKALDNLVIYRPAASGWRLANELYTPKAAFVRGNWIAGNGWQQEFTAGGTSWTPFSHRTLALEPPNYFGAEEPLPEMMTVPQLKQHIKELAASGFNVVSLSVDLQHKLAFPCVTIVMTLLAIPFGLTTGKRGTLYGIGIAIILALGYWVVGGAFDAIGKSGLLGPIMAGWAPNVLAAGGAFYLLLTART